MCLADGVLHANTDAKPALSLPGVSALRLQDFILVAHSQRSIRASRGEACARRTFTRRAERACVIPQDGHGLRFIKFAERDTFW